MGHATVSLSQSTRCFFVFSTVELLDAAPRSRRSKQTTLVWALLDHSNLPPTGTENGPSFKLYLKESSCTDSLHLGGSGDAGEAVSIVRRSRSTNHCQKQSLCEQNAQLNNKHNKS